MKLFNKKKGVILFDKSKKTNYDIYECKCPTEKSRKIDIRQMIPISHFNEHDYATDYYKYDGLDGQPIKYSDLKGSKETEQIKYAQDKIYTNFIHYMIKYIENNDLYQKFNDGYLEEVFRTVVGKCKAEIVNHSTMSSITDPFIASLNLFLEDINAHDLIEKFIITNTNTLKNETLDFIFDDGCESMIAKLPIMTLFAGGNLKIDYQESLKLESVMIKFKLHLENRELYKSYIYTIISQYFKMKFIDNFVNYTRKLSKHQKYIYIDTKMYFSRNGCGYNDMLVEHIKLVKNQIYRLEAINHEISQHIKYFRNPYNSLPKRFETTSKQYEVSALRERIKEIMEFVFLAVNQEEYFKSNYRIERAQPKIDTNNTLFVNAESMNSLFAENIDKLLDLDTDTITKVVGYLEHLSDVINDIILSMNNTIDGVEPEKFDCDGDTQIVINELLLISKTLYGYRDIHETIINQLRSRAFDNCLGFEKRLSKKLNSYFENDVMNQNNFSDYSKYYSIKK